MTNMKNIATKSIHKKPNIQDGIRICVMRRIHPEYNFHIWIPELAPPEKLLEQYVIQKKMSWEEFSYQYIQKVLSKKRVINIIKTLVLMSQFEKITLLCTENSAKHCHRSLIIRECMRQKINIIK